MQVQYVYDENGKKTGVIVPIAFWENVSRRKNSSKPKAAFDPSEYRGLYRNLPLNLRRELTGMRLEWERM